MKFPISLLSILFLVLSCSAPPRNAANEIDFIVLQLNDVYEIAPLEGGKAGGLARVASLRQELLEETPNVISVLSGDFLSPSLMGTLKLPNGEKIAGLQMVETLNTLGLDYVTFGNHEFDISDPDVLQKRIDASTFKWTVCNALRVKDGEKAPFTQNGNPVPKYIVHEMTTPGGKKVRLGLLGVVLPFNQIDYVHYLPVEETFRSTYEVMKEETDLVLGITHLSIDDDLALALKMPEIPLFLGGHDHVNMNRMAGKTVVTKADANAKTVYIHRINYNLETGKTRIRSTLKKIDNNLPEEVRTKSVVDKWQNELTQIITKMGYTPEHKLMVAKELLECKESSIRTRQTNFGTLTVNAFEAVWPGADVYMVNSGSMRLDDDIAGQITEFDVLRTFPFGGDIQQVKIKGADLIRLLDAGLEKNVGEGGFMQISKVTKEQERWMVNNKPIDLNAAYVVVLPGFVASGREANLEFLKDYKSVERESLEAGGVKIKNDIRDILIYYMQTL